ncbi:lysophospholipid acyltransferase family protein [Spelaeicoccus albus]|uniref:1-acyl-sn-glycerol-3-phosphate acyltransferase n=1 Tax=Spelaeicoccus albus TaxID=1280376 RepID=A0A7Z0D554_9MICO|nr:lysophospholipid acyltransferase family protein [Spelaeicoccus albus]NYI69071.1 1-acyl-sn-glycerol-3-phosphate acyltransferase [Spelaeicoccus albus]
MRTKTDKSAVEYVVPSLRAARRWHPIGTAMMSPWRARVHRAELLPQDGGVLIIANHLSYLDGPMVYAHCPRYVHMIVKKEAFKSIAGYALRRSGQIPIDRAGSDRRALNAGLDVLRRGDVLGLFPEGTRGNGAGSAIRNGAAWLALQAKVPIVPVAVLGTKLPGDTKALPPFGRKVDIVYGEPLQIDAAPGQTGRALREEVSRQLGAALSTGLAEAAELTGQRLP